MFKKVIFAILPFLLFSVVPNAAMADSDSSQDHEFDYELGEVVVLDPPKTFTAEVCDQGYSILETITLEGLNIELKRLGIPDRMDVSAAIESLHDQYPDLEVEANYIVLPSDDLTSH